MATNAASDPRVEFESCPRPALEVEERMPGKVAHDLLGIVTIIRGYGELLPLEPSKRLQDDYCRRIVRACNRMVELVDRSLELSRRASGVPLTLAREVAR